jgi:hypothetical protein
MKHPEFFIIPVLMFADYFLTLAGAVLKDKKYADHFKAEHYEMNPVWQKEVEQKKWFNPRHIMLTILISSLLILLVEYGEVDESFTQGMLGCLASIYGMVIGRHLSNLLIFSYINRKPDEIHGEVTMAHTLLLMLSLYQYIVVLVPVLLIAIFSPSPFVTGVLVGVILLQVLHFKWIWMYQKQMKAAKERSKT